MENLNCVSEVKVSFLPDYSIRKRPIITNSKDAYQVLLQVWDRGLMSFLEEFKVILLNNANRVLGVVDIGMGGKDYVPVDMRVIFSIALNASASKIILAHNHPSDKLIPSLQDKVITTKALEAGKLLDIEVCDHLIMGPEGYYSLKDGGNF